MNLIEIFKVLADENRLRIINLLMNHELCVCEIEVILDLSQSNVSRHLSKIKNIEILESSKDAQWIHYKINEDFIKKNEELIAYLKNKFSELRELHNVHIWSITPKMLVFSAHVQINQDNKQCKQEDIISKINNYLLKKYNIIECTIQICTDKGSDVCNI